MRTFLSCLMLVSLVMPIMAIRASALPEPVGRSMLVQHSAPASLSDSAENEITLDGLRDVGLAIFLVKQQAANIFLEATRKAVPVDGSPDTFRPSMITSSSIDPSARYLPPRVEWLVYYVGTMEPIIHLLKEDLRVLRGKDRTILVPKGTNEKLEPVFEAWSKDIYELDEHLTGVSDMIGRPDENVEIARQSVAMFDVSKSLDNSRKKAFGIIQSAGLNPSLVPVPFGRKGKTD